MTLQEFKEVLCDTINFERGDEYLRVREKYFNGFFGKIYRETNKTLKQLNLKDRCSLVL